MESLFSKYPYALLFLGCFFMLIENRSIKKNINSNIIILYIIFSISSIFTVGEYWKNSIILLVLCFSEIEILSISEELEQLLVFARYKLLDFAFKMINKYNIVQVLIINALFYAYDRIVTINNPILWIGYVFIISCMLLYEFGKIYENKFNVKELDKIEELYLKSTIGYIFPSNIGNKKQKLLKKKIDLLLEIEDKTFEYRKSSHSFLCWETLVYKLNKDYNAVDKMNIFESFRYRYKILYIINNISKITKLIKNIISLFFKALISKKSFTEYINRGYSTIEMQLIRTYGIISGYEYVYTRKIYELIYSNIFFKSYFRKTKYYHYLRADDYLKYQIPYAYLKSVRTFINGNVYKNIVEFYEYIRDLSPKEKVPKKEREEIFIFILGLSRKNIDESIIEKYDDLIKKYNINKEKLKKIIEKI